MTLSHLAFNAALCTGCMACLNICPKSAITSTGDERGFYMPQVDAALCVKCGLCQDICPAQHVTQIEERSPKVYAGWNKNEEIRRNSTSGGLFTVLAEDILERGGVVFGAILNENMSVIHASAENTDTQIKMRGSKYVQSYIGDAHRCAKTALEEDRSVLFSGTPCQLDGLQSYLGREYKSLFLVDVVCHGVVSPMIFLSYLRYLSETVNDSGICSIGFRCKELSWYKFDMKADFADGGKYESDMYTDAYLLAFLRDYCLRESCYQCKYANTNRQGDITLGDFWGYISKDKSYRNDDKGISLIMTNTQKGVGWLKRVQEKIVLTSRTLDEAIEENITLAAPTQKPKEADGFWQTFSKRQRFADCIEQYLQPSPGPSIKFRLHRWLDDHFYMLPPLVKTAYMAVRKKHMEKKRVMQKIIN